MIPLVESGRAARPTFAAYALRGGMQGLGLPG
jgi:hypothetical protein